MLILDWESDFARALRAPSVDAEWLAYLEDVATGRSRCAAPHSTEKDSQQRVQPRPPLIILCTRLAE
jgi:hypothetical protein